MIRPKKQGGWLINIFNNLDILFVDYEKDFGHVLSINKHNSVLWHFFYWVDRLKQMILCFFGGCIVDVIKWAVCELLSRGGKKKTAFSYIHIYCVTYSIS